MVKAYFTPPTTPTTKEAELFLRHVLGDQTGYISIFSGVRVPDARLKYREQRFFRCPEELGAAAAHAEDRARERSREVYFSAHAFTERQRRKEHAAPVSCLYAEIDGTRPNEVVKKYATALVESSPGHYHVYVRLTRALPPEEGERLNRRLARTVDADASGWDLSQVLRVPGTPNHKYPDKPTVRLVRLLGAAAHDPEELDRVLDPLPEERTAPIRERTEVIDLDDQELLRKARNSRTGASFKKLYDEGDASEHDGDRSAAVFALAKMLAFWTGWDEARIEELLHASAWREYDKLKRPPWVALTIKKAIAATPRAYGQPAGPDDPLADAVEDLRAQAANLPWEGRGGPTDRPVYGALIERAERYGTLREKSVVVAADERALAQAAGTGRRAVARALERLQKDRKLIWRVRRGRGKRAAVYALKLDYSRGGHNTHTFCGTPLSRLRNPAPMPQKEYDKNGRKIHAPDYLLQRVGKLAALILERVGDAGEEGTTCESLANALNRRRFNIRRKVAQLLEAHLLVTDGDGDRLRLPENFSYLLQQELSESGCLSAEERHRRRFERDREERYKKRPVDDAPTQEDLDREHRTRVEKALTAWTRPKTGPALAFRSYRDGETKKFEFVVNATALYYKADPPAWCRAVEEAYALAVNGEVAS
jgi:RepB DNA-primase from phage plasmid